MAGLSQSHLKTLFILFICVGGLCFGQATQAKDHCTSLVSSITIGLTTPLTVDISNGVTPGTPLGPWSARSGANIYSCETVTLFKLMNHTPAFAAISGLNYSEGVGDYAVFPTEVPGIGVVVVFFRSLTHDSPYALQSSGYVMNFGSGIEPVVDGIAWSARFVVTGTLKEGNHSIAPRLLTTFYLKDAGNPAPISVYLGAAQIQIVANTCLAALPSQGVDLVKRDAAVFDHKGKLEKAGEFEIALNCSGSGGPFDLYATFTDVQSPSNLGTDITLAPGSAKGLGLQLWKDGKALRMGPDSRSPANPNRWYVGKVNGTVNIPLEAWYVQTADAVEPGPVNAAVTYTLSYP